MEALWEKSWSIKLDGEVGRRESELVLSLPSEIWAEIFLYLDLETYRIVTNSTPFLRQIGYDKYLRDRYTEIHIECKVVKPHFRSEGDHFNYHLCGLEEFGPSRRIRFDCWGKELSEGILVHGEKEAEWIVIAYLGIISPSSIILWLTRYRQGKREGRLIGLMPPNVEAWKNVSVERFWEQLRSGELESSWEIVAKGDYVNGKKEGPWLDIIPVRIDSEGLQYDQREGKYSNDKKLGPWKERSSSGIEAIGNYVDDKKEGLWNYYSDGKLFMYGEYRKGFRCGKWEITS